jgi:hypothetical protein
LGTEAVADTCEVARLVYLHAPDVLVPVLRMTVLPDRHIGGSKGGDQIDRTAFVEFKRQKIIAGFRRAPYTP